MNKNPKCTIISLKLALKDIQLQLASTTHTDSQTLKSCL